MFCAVLLEACSAPLRRARRSLPLTLNQERLSTDGDIEEAFVVPENWSVDVRALVRAFKPMNVEPTGERNDSGIRRRLLGLMLQRTHNSVGADIAVRGSVLWDADKSAGGWMCGSEISVVRHRRYLDERAIL